MTAQIPTQPSTSQSAGGPDVPGGTPYPDIAGTSHAAAAAAAFFRAFFTATTSRDVEATQAHFHPRKAAYVEATLGWALPDDAGVRTMREQYMPRWPAGAKSYPTRIPGDMTSAVVFATGTPEPSGGEIRAISVAGLQDGTIVCLVDYGDGRGFGPASPLASARPRSSSARTARSPSSPSYGTAPCSTTGPAPRSPPPRPTGDPPHHPTLSARTGAGAVPADAPEPLAPSTERGRP